ncbi:uncharacterized protein TEOVI_000740200 [Trypanosoma equiperdum]|uniref:Uncharacterized protein n=2 Tax=Trypanozoon TaxID=39700 RepID=Q38BG0_TRYB2|nr:hypothetical protein, conserved [Trypanosoma brucei brucei TREU927]EAN77860.1 hypothetical protein, conserved [Trypanosoma brucei brucei TREU927]SCU67416.1 hypothetical protein, conserved [Trypanosoma equiperdum]
MSFFGKFMKKFRRETPAPNMSEADCSELEEMIKRNPVAATLKDEWALFVHHIIGSPAETRKEIWVEKCKVPQTHSEIDRVGNLFMKFFKDDLIRRKWRGQFSYAVVGRENEGHLEVEVLLHSLKRKETTREVLWNLKLRYHTNAISSEVTDTHKCPNLHNIPL